MQRISIYTALLVLTMALSRPAVSDELDAIFKAFNQAAKAEFTGFSKANEATFAAEFLSQWKTFNKATINKAIALPKPVAQPVLTKSIPTNAGTENLQTTFTPSKQPVSQHGFYGHGVIALPLYNLPALTGVTPENLLIFRQQALASSDFNELFLFTNFMQKRVNAGNFASLLLSQNICGMYYTSNDTIACTWLLTQSLGLDVLVGVRQQQLLLLTASNQEWFENPFFTVDSTRFYVVNKNQYLLAEGNTQLQTNSHADATIQTYIVPSTDITPAAKNLVTINKLGHSFTIDSDHVAYLFTLPILDMASYLHDQTPAYLTKQLTDWFANIKTGDNKKELVAVLNQLQKLPYQTDTIQFGYEKPLTLSELLYFDYSDCEDRVYALSALNKQFLGYSIAGLLYPKHLSAAIKLDDEWIEADPTYLGASLGMRQPAYADIEPRWIY